MSYLWPDYGQSSYKMNDMTNIYNLSYIGNIYVGTGAQVLDVVWDTGSGSFLARSSYCTSCDSGVTKFDVTASTSWSKMSPETEKTVTYLDGTELSGYYGYDRVCAVNHISSCAGSFKFVAIHTASGLRSYEDGIIGLHSGNTSSSSYDRT